MTLQELLLAGCVFWMLFLSVLCVGLHRAMLSQAKELELLLKIAQNLTTIVDDMQSKGP